MQTSPRQSRKGRWVQIAVHLSRKVSARHQQNRILATLKPYIMPQRATYTQGILNLTSQPASSNPSVPSGKPSQAQALLRGKTLRAIAPASRGLTFLPCSRLVKQARLMKITETPIKHKTLKKHQSSPQAAKWADQ